MSVFPACVFALTLNIHRSPGILPKMKIAPQEAKPKRNSNSFEKVPTKKRPTHQMGLTGELNSRMTDNFKPTASWVCRFLRMSFFPVGLKGNHKENHQNATLRQTQFPFQGKPKEGDVNRVTTNTWQRSLPIFLESKRQTSTRTNLIVPCRVLKVACSNIFQGLAKATS